MEVRRISLNIPERPYRKTGPQALITACGILLSKTSRNDISDKVDIICRLKEGFKLRLVFLKGDNRVQVVVGEMTETYRTKHPSFWLRFFCFVVIVRPCQLFMRINKFIV